MRLNPKSRRRGAAAVEFALVLPVYLTLLLGVLEFARMGMAVQVMTNAAREGCRVAAMSGRTAADAQTRVNTVLAASNMPSTTIALSPADPSSAAGGTAITLTITIPFSQVSWLRASTFLQSNLQASATFTSER